MTRVTVIMPVYNTEPFLERAIASLAGQTFHKAFPDSLEVIAVNDASPDNSLHILREAERRYPTWFHVLSLPENRGIGGARNAGLDLAKGEYVGFIDSDDEIDPTMYEKLYVAATAGEEFDIADCGVINEHVGGADCFSTTQDMCGHLDDAGRARLISSVGYVVTRLVRRELLEKYHIRFREHVIMEDQDFSSTLFAVASSITLVPECLYHYLVNPNSVTRDDYDVNFFEGTVMTMRAVYDRLSVLPNYEGIRSGAEYFFLEAVLLVMLAINDYVAQKAITPELAKQMKGILRTDLRRFACASPLDNSFAAERMSLADRELLMHTFFDDSQEQM